MAAVSYTDQSTLRVIQPNVRLNAPRAARSVKIPQTFAGIRFMAAHRSLLCPSRSEPMVEELVESIYRRGGIILALDTALMFRTGPSGRDGSSINQDTRLELVAASADAFLTPTRLTRDEAEDIKKTWGLCHLPLPVVRFRDIYQYIRDDVVQFPRAERCECCPPCQQRHAASATSHIASGSVPASVSASVSVTEPTNLMVPAKRTGHVDTAAASKKQRVGKSRLSYSPSCPLQVKFASVLFWLRATEVVDLTTQVPDQSSLPALESGSISDSSDSFVPGSPNLEEQLSPVFDYR